MWGGVRGMGTVGLAVLVIGALEVGAAQRVLATVVNFWDALDRKREMPIVPAA